MRFMALAPLSLLLASASPYEERRAVEDLTAVERAFAADAQQGMWPAFSKYIAEDGVIFRPGPVNGKTWLSTAEASPPLDWWPTFIEISCDDTLGWSTGPVIAESKVISHYVTIWGRRAGGDWRFLLDYGNPQRPAEIDSPRMRPTRSVRHECGGGAGSAEKSTQSLFAADDALSAQVGKDNRAAYRAALAAQTRFHRWGKQPVLELEPSLAALETEPRTYATKRLGGKAAASGDLGFTYGDATWQEPERGEQKGYYLRMWRREGGQWKLGLDQIRPLTPKRPGT